ncbi:MAG TPA: 5-(carboxyamino)imidazole ribonucleotide mutase [Phycisphaerae bacterium]|nr:5-(carboxyamino)imidazole ribonucleotide mutase [Phycisphaerae bacterium]HRY68844.1 5-(carboxyamino)imidazole ribonucleotide mutase [Phycisphaerae bacterium]HSA27509.1 5-(carboxyamino)imidazole ribonucleotide mutase [Phycisphaerae bacterium]
MKRAKVAIIMGSDSDWPTLEACYQDLTAWGVCVEAQILSAHRTPEQLRAYVTEAEARGVEVFIAAAGMAAALPGAVAAYTIRPVIGVPLACGPLQGVDSLLSIVQMPPGVPVATVAIGSAGAKNAAILALQILSVADDGLKEALRKSKAAQSQTVDNKNRSLQERIARG